jgi:hypothetical protein
MDIRFETQFGGRGGSENAVPLDAILIAVHAVSLLNTEVFGEDLHIAECIRRIIFLFTGNRSDIHVDCIITVAQRIRTDPNLDHVFECVVNWHLTRSEPAVALAQAVLDKLRMHIGRPKEAPRISGKMQFKVV